MKESNKTRIRLTSVGIKKLQHADIVEMSGLKFRLIEKNGSWREGWRAVRVADDVSCRLKHQHLQKSSLVLVKV